jgi:glycosyltransferase involved in cell wall biosynthesis
VISSYYGIDGNITTWEGFLVLPKGQDPYGSDIIAAHTERTHCEALVTLMDAWVLDQGQIRDIRDRLRVPVAAWLPVDVERLGEADQNWLEGTGAFPIAMSKHGRAQIEAKGLQCGYVPHGVDCQVFKPPADRGALRASFNTAGRFSCGIAAANKGSPSRKNFADHMEVFRIFRERHPEANALLLVHSWRATPGGENLQRMAERKGIADAISFSDQWAYTIGQIKPPALNDWYGAIDVLLNCSAGEGFGIPVIEAQAAGTPVIVNDSSAMRELCGAGWKVRGQPLHNEFHGEDWQTPDHKDMLRALEKAYELWKNNERDGGMDRMREKARKFALRYDADLVLKKYWVPVLKEIERMRHRMLTIGADRDAAVARLSEAWSAGSLDAEAFGDRAGKALVAARQEDLVPLLEDLQEAA